MIATVSIFCASCILMILSVLFFPKLWRSRFAPDSYWVITLIGALLLIFSGVADARGVFLALIADNAVNPIKILVLFISMTVLSVYLDELGLFRYLANTALRHAGGGQIKLFIILYATVSVLTVFTSNDVIILSFTPFICYFAKNAGISPIPYLAAEFVAANTWSMMLVIGNPTNIYLATSAGIGFIEYFLVMAIPTLLGGTTAFLSLLLLFRKKLSAKIECSPENAQIKDKLLLAIGVAHLSVCTVLLAISSYIGLEMWLVSLVAVISLFLITDLTCIARKKSHETLHASLGRAPWQLIPFIISMFVMILTLGDYGVTDIISRALGDSLPVFTYGFSSFLAANVVNNIPMSVLFASVIPEGAVISEAATYATVIGSNIGAIFTPIGALAGIMWCSILSKHQLRFDYLHFLKMGIAVAIPTLSASLIGLYIVL